MTSDFLRRQHEEQRLRHAIDYIHEATHGAKKLTTSELARLNQIITAAEDTAWRTEPASIQLPTGKVHRFSLISNPIDDARRILSEAFEIANNESVEDAAVFVYLRLVEEHLFEEANRRTAALAAQWLVNTHDLDIDPVELLKIPLGDVRDPAEKNKISKKIKTLVKSSED